MYQYIFLKLVFGVFKPNKKKWKHNPNITNDNESDGSGLCEKYREEIFFF